MPARRTTDHRPQNGRSQKRVETAAMGVAGHVVELLELSENGKIDIRAEGARQVGERCDFVSERQLPQRIGRERERSHNVIVSTGLRLQSRHYNNITGGGSNNGQNRLLLPISIGEIYFCGGNILARAVAGTVAITT